MPLASPNVVQSGRFHLKLLGAVLLFMALASGVLLLLSALDWVQLEYTLSQKIAASIEVPLMAVLGVWCLSGSKMSWYISLGYLVVSLTYHAGAIVVSHGIWGEEDQLQLAFLAIFYAGMTRAFSGKAILKFMGLKKRPIVIELFVLFSIGVGCFLLLRYFFNTLVGLFVLAVILGPWVRSLTRNRVSSVS